MRELELLHHIFAGNASLDAGLVTIPPGDDMGAVRVEEQEWLLTVDQVADRVHFDLGTAPLEKIGRKAITRNLSDVAAMAAEPVCALAAAMLPRDLDETKAKVVFDALRSTAQQFGCPVIGGDISIWSGRLVVTVTVLAKPGPVAPVRRCDAKGGQGIYVTGELGGSGVDLHGRVHHLDFEPRLEVAHELARKLGAGGKFPGAMIDLSDGLATDLRHICEASRVRAELWPQRLPISDAAREMALQTSKSPWQHALADGEDYELCFTAPAGLAGNLGEVAGVRVTEIGRILAAEDGATISLKWADGRSEPLTLRGWEHQGP